MFTQSKGSRWAFYRSRLSTDHTDGLSREPPFNTQKTFAAYEDNLEHSVWLTMMRDRLEMMLQLLRRDGTIWVHLNYDENHRMRLLLDEVLGPSRFIAEVVWQKADSSRNDPIRGISVDQDVILVYGGPDAELLRLPRTAEDDLRFTNPDNDPNGRWFDDNPQANRGDGAGGMCYAIQNPLTGEMMRPAQGANWRFGQDRILELMNQWAPYRLENLHDQAIRAASEGIPLEKVKKDVCALVLDVPLDVAQDSVRKRWELENWPALIVRQSGGIGRKAYIPQRGKVARTWWTHDEVGHNREASYEMKALFPGSSQFDTPKPERLLERVISISTEPGDIVLDCFAGSGTTAAVAHKLGRRWVTCELLEPNFRRFVLPRLKMVTSGSDLGGITTKSERVAVAEVPEGLLPKDMQRFTTILNKLIDSDDGTVEAMPVDLSKLLATKIRADSKAAEPTLSADESKLLLSLLKRLDKSERFDATSDLLGTATSLLRKAAKTRNVETAIWEGGGGFDVAHLSPAWAAVDDRLGFILLTADATGEVLIRSIAAHLEFALTPAHPLFDGIKGRRRLVVAEGFVDEDMVTEYLDALAPGELLTVAALGSTREARQLLRQESRGSRILTVPGDLFVFDPAGGTGIEVAPEPDSSHAAETEDTAEV